MNEEEKLRIVTVVNNFEFYDKVLKLSPSLKNHNITVFDNTRENIGISKRYNSFIEQHVKKDSNFWVVFCHQDFGFFKDPYDVLKNADKNFVYGVVGPRIKFDLIRYVKAKLVSNMAYYPSLKIDLKGLNPFSEHKFISIRKKDIRGRHLSRKLLGQIDQGENNFEFRKSGIFVNKPKTVYTVDCCCVIAHSSLLAKYNLRFDENLSWHMYAEEFCINAKRAHGILAKVIQLDAFHTSTGNLENLDASFYESVEYVKKKHSIRYIHSTCID